MIKDKMMRYLAVLALLIATPALAAPPTTSFRCLGVGATTTLLPASGYIGIKKLGEQKGIIYFDATHRHQWYRIGVDSCSATIVFLKRERMPASQ